MCLGVPGKILEISDSTLGISTGKVSFGGVTKEVCLACVPEAKIGDYVLVHVGFALSLIDEAEANEVFRILDAMGELRDLGDLQDLGDPQDFGDPDVPSPGDAS